MGLFDASEDKLRVWERELAEAVRPWVDSEEILAVGAFRRGGFTAEAVASRVSGLAAAAVALANKRRGGGLPPNVILAVTPERVYAFSHKQGKYVPREEVARWDRAGIRSSCEARLGLTELTLASPAEGELVRVVPMGVKDDPVNRALIDLLVGAHGQAAD